jgi:hypothetical protein
MAKVTVWHNYTLPVGDDMKATIKYPNGAPDPETLARDMGSAEELCKLAGVRYLDAKVNITVKFAD